MRCPQGFGIRYDAKGAIIVSLVEGGVAEAAKVPYPSLVLRVGGVPVQTKREIITAIRKFKFGESVQFVVRPD